MATKSIVERATRIQKLIKKHGSPYKAALAEGVSPQAFYERMDRLNIPRTKRVILGEPKTKAAQKVWITNLFKREKSITNIANHLGCCKESVQKRARQFGIKPMANRGVEPVTVKTLIDRKKWLEGLLKKHGNINQVAKALNVTPAAMYERCKRYGIEYHQV